jgi:hypothetical protein
MHTFSQKLRPTRVPAIEIANLKFPGRRSGANSKRFGKYFCIRKFQMTVEQIEMRPFKSDFRSMEAVVESYDRSETFFGDNCSGVVKIRAIKETCRYRYQSHYSESRHTEVRLILVDLRIIFSKIETLKAACSILSSITVSGVVQLLY